LGLYPYRFTPIYKEKIWGGRALERLFGRPLPAGAKIGESWELADLEEGESVLADGPDAGRTLNGLLGEEGPELLGPGAALPNGRFPLLLKLLDANDILSLQVHPDERAVAELGPPAALKTECWYVVESRGGYILKGVREGVTIEDFRQALEAGDDPEVLMGLVRRYDVKAGDFHYLPAGTLHALGAGVVVAEIQTPSDTTYRVSDWGRGREVHVAEALQCIRPDLSTDPPGAGGDVLLRTPYFDVARRNVAGRQRLEGGSLRAWMVLDGAGTVADSAGGPEVQLSPGDSVVLPAGLAEPVLEAGEGMSYLEITLPA